MEICLDLVFSSDFTATATINDESKQIRERQRQSVIKNSILMNSNVMLDHMLYATISQEKIRRNENNV